MAHQWFGDLVTTAWWNDTWLNEAFATWMESKIPGEWQPGWHLDVTVVNARLRRDAQAMNWLRRARSGSPSRTTTTSRTHSTISL